jgi:cytidyltransferase-like protein
MSVGLTIGRFQPCHQGHCRIINRMIEDCKIAIVGLGSAGVPRSRSNPFTVEERTIMLREIYGDRIKILPLKDLGATGSTNDWIDYVLEKINRIGLPNPDHLYSGSLADASWYRNRFYMSNFSPEELVSTKDSQFRISDMHDKRILHVIDRETNSFPSASEIRTFIELGNNMWKKYVPVNLHIFIKQNYPSEFLVGKS